MSATVSTPATVTAPGPASAAAPPAAVDIPNEKVLTHAAKIAVERDMPILLDYYADTKSGKAFLGEDSETKEKILVKNPDEYTSPVQKMFKAKDDYIIMTENSLYCVCAAIPTKRIS
jgi:3-oxoacyl-ACP reductase-like protein